MDRTRSGVGGVVALSVLAVVLVGLSGSGSAVQGETPGVEGDDWPVDGPPVPPGANARDAGQASGSDDDVRTATEERVPTAEDGVPADAVGEPSALAGGDLPPGVTSSGVANASRLVEAHRQGLAESSFSFTLETNLSSGFAGGVDQWAVQNGTVETGLSPFRFRTVSRLTFENETAGPEATTTEAWGNDTAVVVRTRTDDVTQVQRVGREDGGELHIDGRGTATTGQQPVDLSTLLTGSSVVETVLRSGEYEVADVRQEAGTTLATLRATALEQAVVDDAGNVSTFAATLVVDGDGVVRELDYDLAYERGDGPDVRYRYRLSDLGTATVTEPPWVAEAAAADETTDSTGVVVPSDP